MAHDGSTTHKQIAVIMNPRYKVYTVGPNQGMWLQKNRTYVYFRVLLKLSVACIACCKPFKLCRVSTAGHNLDCLCELRARDNVLALAILAKYICLYLIRYSENFRWQCDAIKS